ncbi:MAG: SDR family NAD(P)-dependent oxidoreductase [Burkholderiaceae bacterium]|nr:SDR family NAD(P)-dependent oxidoreductase [Burkholderiaceae bacterium]
MSTHTSAQPRALIVGAGAGLSASVARQLAARGYAVTLAARNVDKLAGLAREIGATRHVCNSASPEAVERLFAYIDGPLRVVVYNPSARVRGPLVTLDPEAVRYAVEVTAFGAFLVSQQAARRMLGQPLENDRHGTILLTGASAGVKGFAHSAAFAMGKFAQRGLAQSMARELHPLGIHVAWVNVDGGIRSASRPVPPERPDSLLDPDAIAQTYLALIDQHRSAWSDEVTVRPWVETF